MATSKVYCGTCTYCTQRMVTVAKNNVRKELDVCVCPLKQNLRSEVDTYKYHYIEYPRCDEVNKDNDCPHWSKL